VVPSAGPAAVKSTDDEVTQCLHWVADAYNEFLMHGMLSDELVRRLQIVYDKLRSRETETHSGREQTMSNLTKMIGTSISSGMKLPSLLNMNIPPPPNASAIPTVGGVEPNPLSTTTASHQERSRSRSVEKPDATDGRLLVGNKSQPRSPDSHASSGLADSETMELGSENGAGPYSPFDSPFNLEDTKRAFAAPNEGKLTEFGSINVQETFMKDSNAAGVAPNSSPFRLAGSDRSHAKPPPPPKPVVLSPQDALAARISDEIALIEVLVRIQFELASIGDLSAEDAAAAGITVASEPPASASVPAALQSPPITTTAASEDPMSLLGSTFSLPALPSPGFLQELISQPTTPTSTKLQSPVTSTASAAVLQTAVSLSQGNTTPSSLSVKGRLPYTPPIAATSTPSISDSTSTDAKPSGVQSQAPVAVSTTKANTSSTTSSSQQVTSKQSTSAPKTSSSTATKSGFASSATSKDESGKVHFAYLFSSSPIIQLK